jgi:hypothetical protein
MAVMTPLMAWFVAKKRYGCCDCGWRGWKRPMLRRGKAKPRTPSGLQTQVSPMTSALVVGASICGIVLASLQAGCNPSPSTPDRGLVEIVKSPF